MAKELVFPDSGGDLEFRAWYETLVDIREAAREMKYDLAESLKQARDRGYDKRLGYARFEEFVVACYGISARAAYEYISIAENVIGVLPEDVCAALTGGDNPLPLKVLAALHFDQITPREVERIRKMDPGEQKEELLKIGYDRDRMGGRAASDLLRKRLGKRTYRDQSRKIQVRDEKIRLQDGEIEELKERNKAQEARIEQIIAAMENPESAKVVKQIDALTVRLAELEKARAADEAEIATGKEVGTRALILSGEIQALLGRFEDSVRIDNSKQWTEVWRIVDSIQEAIGDCRGRMAQVILARIEDGEITRFAVEEPGEEVRTAEAAMRPRGKKE